VKLEGNLAVIDVRQQALKKEHPSDKVLDYIRQAPSHTVFEIHVPHMAQPLVEKLEDLGMEVSRNKIETNHYYLVVTK